MYQALSLSLPLPWVDQINALIIELSSDKDCHHPLDVKILVESRTDLMACPLKSDLYFFCIAFVIVSSGEAVHISPVIYSCVYLLKLVTLPLRLRLIILLLLYLAHFQGWAVAVLQEVRHCLTVAIHSWTLCLTSHYHPSLDTLSYLTLPSKPEQSVLPHNTIRAWTICLTSHYHPSLNTLSYLTLPFELEPSALPHACHFRTMNRISNWTPNHGAIIGYCAALE